MSNTAEYTLKLKDEFSHGMHDAKGHADALHHSMEGLKEIVGEVIAVYAGFEVLKESLHEFELHKEAVASLSQMYKNNSDYIHENIDALKELAEHQENTTGIHSEDTMAAEQNLMKFRDLKIGYEELIPVIEDFAKATKTDAADAANTMGRAMENPERAMRLLMQAGVGPRQIAFIRGLQQAGHTAEAQAQIFEALKDKYHGVAKAMYEANPLTQIEIQFKQTKETIGEFEDKLLAHLMPTIRGTFEHVRELVHWMEKNKDIVKEVGVAVSVLVGAYAAHAIILKSVAMWEGIVSTTMATKNVVMEIAAGMSVAMAEGYGVLEAAQWSLNIAMEANPIGAVILAITALGAAVAAVVLSYKQLREQYQTQINDRTQHVINNEKIEVMQLALTYEKMGKSKKEAMEMAVNFERGSIEYDRKHAEKELQSIEGKIERLKQSGYLGDVSEIDRLQEKKLLLQKNITDYATEKRALNEFVKEKNESKTDKKGIGDSAFKAIDKTDNISGTKQVIINVTIAKMIGVDKFIGTSKEVVIEAGEKTEKLLLAAVNEFQASIDT